MQVRNPTDKEMIELAGHPELILGMKMLECFDQWKKEGQNAQAPTDNRASRRAHKSR
jgi:hypothetical protein